MISFLTPTIKFKLFQQHAAKSWLKSLIDAENKKLGELAFIFCSDDELLQLNRQYLHHDYFTDVITFDYCEANRLSGDVFISVDTVRLNAQEYQQSFNDELSRVMVHGVLHLCGYADGTDEEKQQMKAKEDFYLAMQSQMYSERLGRRRLNRK